MHLPWVVEALPTLLDLSLFLFFAGLVIYLFNINHTVSTVVAWWVGLCTATYLGVALMPFFRCDSPYYAPLLSSAWNLVNGALRVILEPLLPLVMSLVGYEICDRSTDLVFGPWIRFKTGITSAAEYAAEKRSLEADLAAFKTVLGFSDGDLHLEEFFALIPGFFKSKVVQDAQHIFKDCLMSGYLLDWMNRTLSSHTLTDVIKERRIALCREVMDITSLPVDCDPLFYGLYNWDKFFCWIDSALVLKAATYFDPDALYVSKYAISIILANVQERDKIWYELAIDNLGVSEPVFQGYLAHGDSVSLANLNSYIRRTIDLYPRHKWFLGDMVKTLKAVSKLNVQDTLPELRHDFCTLWNELVLISRADSPSFFGPNEILTGIRDIYVALHLSTASTLPTAFSVPARGEDRFSFSLEPPSYPLCTLADHHPGSASHVHDDIADITDLPAQISTTMFGGGKILDSNTPADVDALSSPSQSPYYADISPANKYSLDDLPPAPRRHSTSIRAPSTPATHISPVFDESRTSLVNPFDSTTTLVMRNSIYTDALDHTANSHSRTSLLQTTSTPLLPLFSISHSNRTISSQQCEESTAVPLSTFSYPPSSSIPSSTSNAPPASSFSRLFTSAGDHIPTILVCSSFNLNRRSITHLFVGHFQF